MITDAQTERQVCRVNCGALDGLATPALLNDLHSELIFISNICNPKISRALCKCLSQHHYTFISVKTASVDSMPVERT